MSNPKTVHNVTSIPKDAPAATEEADDTMVEKVPGRVKNFMHTNKKFFIGAGAGIAAGVGILALAKTADNEEETEETPKD